MASIFGTYIGGNRIGGASEPACKNTLRRVASSINYLGQQDAARKRGQLTQAPRPWAGAKCMLVEGEGLYVLTTWTKWDREKMLVTELLKDLELGEDTLLEKAIGFLYHSSQTYSAMFPYLKGFYNTLNEW